MTRRAVTVVVDVLAVVDVDAAKSEESLDPWQSRAPGRKSRARSAGRQGSGAPVAPPTDLSETPDLLLQCVVKNCKQRIRRAALRKRKRDVSSTQRPIGSHACHLGRHITVEDSRQWMFISCVINESVSEGCKKKQQTEQNWRK